MRHIKLFVGIVVVLAVFVTTLAGTGTSSAEPAAQSGGSNGNVSTGPIPQASIKAWTQEAMDSAIPYPMPSLPGGPKAATQTQAAPTGPAGAVAGGLPGVNGSPKALSGADPSVTGFAPLGYGYPAPFTRFTVFPSTNYKLYPFSTVGKVYFSHGSLNYVCSGSAIGNRMVWTAGHCVADSATHTFHTNWSFVPAYANGAKPFGQWYAFRLATKAAFINSGNLGQDFGTANVTDIGGLKLAQKVGYLGFLYNTSRNMHWNDLGYPQASPFNGQWMFDCQGSHAYDDASWAPYPATSAMGCDMTGGSSGGPWIVNLSPLSGAYNYLNGNNSYRYTNRPKEMYTPYFDSSAKSLYDYSINY